ncbi:MAG: hypothetical protein IJV27_09395 [Prevotella sp.]|nr:hypothetical protein [Prevotella sp.]
MHLDIIIRNDFHQRKDYHATHQRLVETAELLNQQLKTDALVVKTDYDIEDCYFIDDICFQREIGEIRLCDGMWWLCSGWKHCQYMWEWQQGTIREMLYKYVKVLGSEAYICSQRQTWDTDFWEEETITFEKWKQCCIAKQEHDIEILNIEKAIKNEDYPKADTVYLDQFIDLEENYT